MKKTLVEELERIHSLTYGKQSLQEQGILDKMLSAVGLKDDEGKKVDDPKKADLVSADVQDFYKSLETASKSGISQQEKGSMTFQKEVESMQIGLMILGYDLPRHGVDGLFGPETAAAVRKFKSDNVQINEASSELRSTIDTLGYDEKGNQLTSGGEITDEISTIVSNVLKDFKQIKPNVKVIATAGNDKFHQGLSYKSKHTEGKAVDLTLQPYNSENAKAFLQVLSSYKNKDSKFSFIDEYTNPSKASTGGHFHLQYGAGAASGSATEVATPEMLTKLIEMLKAKGVKSEDLKKYIDSVLTGGSAAFTDIDLTTTEGVEKYALICQKFIDAKKPNPLGITGTMMAKGAVKAFERYQKFVPAELALAQLVAEGGISNGDVNSRPIRTKNPFNVGNVDSGANQTQSTVQDGIDTYYALIAKNYLGGGRTASDLVKNFTNKSGQRYASNTQYEKTLNTLAGQANSIAQSIA